MDYFCKIGKEIISIPSDNKCYLCIRPIEKLRLCKDSLCWIARCKYQGCECNEMCSNWIFDNGFCIFHSLIRKEFGFPEKVEEKWISEGLEFHWVLHISGYTFHKLITNHKQREKNNQKCKESIVENMILTYEIALSKAARLHFLIKEVFNKHLLPELYPLQIWK